MTNFKFGTIPNEMLLATSFDASNLAATNYSVDNLISNNRGAHYRRSTKGTSTIFDFDMSASATLSPDFLIIARADILRNSDSAAVDITVEIDDDDEYGSSEAENLTLDTTDLVCRTVQDAVFDISFATAERYLRVTIATTEQSYHEFSKLVLGNWFDLGREPSTNLQITHQKRTEDNYHSRQRFSLDFAGVTNAKRIEFYQLIDRHRNTKPLFIYDDEDLVLEGAKLAQVRIIDIRYDVNFYESKIRMTLEEVY